MSLSPEFIAPNKSGVENFEERLEIEETERGYAHALNGLGADCDGPNFVGQVVRISSFVPVDKLTDRGDTDPMSRVSIIGECRSEEYLRNPHCESQPHRDFLEMRDLHLRYSPHRQGDQSGVDQDVHSLYAIPPYDLASNLAGFKQCCGSRKIKVHTRLMQWPLK